MLLENNRAIAGYTKALEFRNGKSFRRVTEAVYGRYRFRYGWKKQNVPKKITLSLCPDS
ncbi:hypothetical protein [Nostoc sp. FACHB-888]|uniref:hypothetical protein n=1 Tax=Nostoc sp. FACHB-888 TaxID=2692842 RepID=UPI00168678F3|nr:hypothetical protein [Nostoc sp. FACHB-888]MBD2249479.1 hypothetical protein [Nostoc sp. FACHB-888]